LVFDTNHYTSDAVVGDIDMKWLHNIGFRHLIVQRSFTFPKRACYVSARLECDNEKLTDDGRQMMAKAHIAFGKVS
jgi:hypothetical protein